MPQIFNVLRCYKCFIFQIHQTKKNNKWECKMCGEKQSIKRHYGIGTSKDCRLHVQKLNLLHSVKHSDPDILSDDNSDHNENMSQNIPSVPPAKVSKWSHYTDERDVKDEAVFLNSSDKYTKEKTKSKQIEEVDEFVSEINDRGVCNRKIGNSKKCSKFVCPSNKEEYPCIGINGQISNETNYRKPASLNEQYNDWRNNNCVEKKILKKEPMISTSKWASFLDGEGLPSPLDVNLSSNVINGKSDVVLSVSKLDKNQQSTKSSILKSNDTDLESLNSNVTFCKQSMFSMSDDQDLDSILDF